MSISKLFIKLESLDFNFIYKKGVTPMVLRLFRIYRVCHEKVFQIHMLLTINRLERWDNSPFIVFFDELLNFWRL